MDLKYASVHRELGKYQDFDSDLTLIWLRPIKRPAAVRTRPKDHVYL